MNQPLSTPNGGHAPAIDIRCLRVDYGTFCAVDDLTLSVPPGEVFGLVGPNGAGKTSTFRVLTTLMEPTYGEVILAGVDVLEDQAAARRVIAALTGARKERTAHHQPVLDPHASATPSRPAAAPPAHVMGVSAQAIRRQRAFALEAAHRKSG